jgi:hypothetical protein
LQGSGEVNNRIRVIERGHEVTPSSERSNLVRQLIEPAPQRGTNLSRYSGHGNGASSPNHAHRLPDPKPRRRVNGPRLIDGELDEHADILRHMSGLRNALGTVRDFVCGTA